MFIRSIFVVLIINCSFVNYAISTKISGDDINKLNEVINVINDKYPSSLKNETIIDGALDGMLRSVDSYSTYYSPTDYTFFKTASSGRYGGVGITYDMFNNYFKIINVSNGEAADLAGIMRNDVIIAVDDVPANTLTLAKISNMIRGHIGKKVKIKILRQDKEFTFNITRQEIKDESVSYAIYENIAIFKISAFSQQTYDQLLFGIKKNILQNKKVTALIIDLRDNPGGLLDASVDISNLFLQDYVKIVSVKTKDKYVLEEYVANDLPDVIHGLPIVVLTNHDSASASEIVAAALRDNKRAVLVGETTFGKATVQAFIELNSIPGAAVKITIGSYYTPKDSQIDQVGITPDIIVKNPDDLKLHSSNLILDNDLQMKKAIEIVSNQKLYNNLLKIENNNVIVSHRRW